MANHVNPTSSSKETVAGIQVLRAVAVLVVTICHAQVRGPRVSAICRGRCPPPRWQGLATFGVQLFFVISGFVMVYATEPLFGTRRGPFVFLERRIVRIVPLYWVVTTFYLALTLVFAKFDKGYPVELRGCVVPVHPLGAAPTAQSSRWSGKDGH